MQEEEEFYEEPISLGEINMYLNLLENLNNKRYETKEYDKMIKDLKEEFGLLIKKEKLILLFEGSDELKQEVDDRYFIIKNIWC